MRGYFGIGVLHPKHDLNIGGLLRHARLFGASFVFTIGRRYRKQASDTTKAQNHIPMYHFCDYDDFHNHRPVGCELVCVELAPEAREITNFIHPQRAAYLLGAEDHGIPPHILNHRAQHTIYIPTPEPWSMNVTHAGTLVMYDRFMKATSIRSCLP